MKLPIRALTIGTIFAAVFSYIAVIGSNRFSVYLPSTQISAVCITFCLILVLAVNPLLRLIRLRTLDMQEIFLIFIMATVPAGLAVFGYVGNSIPFIATLNNPKWNNPQSQLDSRINPITDQSLFMGDPLFEFRDIDNWQEFAKKVTAGENNLKSPAGKVWDMLAPDDKNTMKEAAGGKELDFDTRVKMGISFKQILSKRDFYDKESFSSITIPEKAQKLIDNGIEILDSKFELTILNRILMEESFPDTVRKSKYAEGIEAIKYYNRGMRAAGKNAYPVFIKKDDDSFYEYVKGMGKYVLGNKDNRKLMGDVPWGTWLPPLLYWGIIGVALIVFFYALNEIVFKQWYENEKIIFPIAELAEAVITPEEDPEGRGGRVPAVFKNPVFWVGFGIAFLIMFYNGMVAAKWFDGLAAVDLSGRMREKLTDTVLEGLNPHFSFHIFFLCIGLAFLLPAEISFSTWFFFVFMRFQQLVAVWLGYGIHGGSFPSNWMDRANFMTAQGGGAMEVFGFVCMWKVRHRLFAFFYKLARPEGNKKLSKEDIKEYSTPSLLFFIATVFIFYFLRRGDVSWGMCFLTYIACLFLTISMVRLVAECGIIGFQIQWGAIHMLKTLSLYKFTALFSTKGLGTVMMMIGGMFVELKTFIAPTMMNGKYLAEKSKLSKKNFAIALILCIGVTFVVSAITIIALANDQGVGAMGRWFFINLPGYVYKMINGISVSIDTSLAQGGNFFDDNAPWFAVGGATCGLIIYLRQFMFWVPHPIGLLMFVNPLMGSYWFSFFVAWICKKAAVKYCDPDSYKFIRGFFIGLIIGEVIAVAIASILPMFGYDVMGLTLNKGSS
ncbi:MAG: DUF6785 family protein, partial [Planctomycetota bacterium]